MLKKIGLIALAFLAGILLGGVGTMAYSGYTLAHGMFILQDMDLSRAEDSATQAYLNESAEVGIWALEHYLDFYEAVIKQRTEAIEGTSEEAKKVFLFADPNLRWVTYIRLGILYEKVGDMSKRDISFEKAKELFGAKAEDENINEQMIKIVKKFDEKIKLNEFETNQEE